MAGISAHLAHRHLVRAPVALFPLTVDLLGTGPPLRRAHDDHRPDRAFCEPIAPCVGLDVADLANHCFEGRSHELVHRARFMPFDEMGRISISTQKRFKLLMTDPRQHCWIGDFIAVEMQDRQHGAVAHWIEELIGVPARGEWSRLRFAVADDRGDDQIRIVKSCAEGVRKRIAELAALVDGAGRLRRDVARDSAGK